MKAFLKAIFGIFFVTAMMMAAIIYFFGNHTQAYSASATMAPAVYGEQRALSAAEELETVLEKLETFSEVLDIFQIEEGEDFLYRKIVARTLTKRSYDEREKEFAAVLRAQLATILNMGKIDCYVNCENNIVFVELAYKDRDTAYRVRQELASDPNVKNVLKSFLLFISLDGRNAAVEKGLTNTQVATAYNDVIDDRPLFISLNDKIFYDYYDSYNSPPELSYSQMSAITDAQFHLRLSPYSKEALIDRLSETHTMTDALFAIDYLERHLDVLWLEQAIRAAQRYLDASGFSRERLLHQLTSETGERFTRWDAVRAVEWLETTGFVDWNKQALQAAYAYAQIVPYSQNEFMEHLTNEDGEGFTWEQALYAVDYINENGASDIRNDIRNVKLYPSGLYKAGEDIPEGEYLLFTTGEEGWFSVSKDLAGEETIFDDTFRTNSIISTEAGEYLDLRQGIAVLADDFYNGHHTLILENDYLMIEAGRELKAGYYKVVATGEPARVRVYNSSRQIYPISDVVFDGTTYVQLSEGQCLKMENCKVFFNN